MSPLFNLSPTNSGNHYQRAYNEYDQSGSDSNLNSYDKNGHHNHYANGIGNAQIIESKLFSAKRKFLRESSITEFLGENCKFARNRLQVENRHFKVLHADGRSLSLQENSSAIRLAREIHRLQLFLNVSCVPSNTSSFLSHQTMGHNDSRNNRIWSL